MICFSIVPLKKRGSYFRYPYSESTPLLNESESRKSHDMFYCVVNCNGVREATGKLIFVKILQML